MNAAIIPPALKNADLLQCAVVRSRGRDPIETLEAVVFKYPDPWFRSISPCKGRGSETIRVRNRSSFPALSF